MNFKLGEAVRHMSGGPLMAIEDIDEGYATCGWFSGTSLERVTFHFSVLKREPQPARDVLPDPNDDEKDYIARESSLFTGC